MVVVAPPPDRVLLRRRTNKVNISVLSFPPAIVLTSSSNFLQNSVKTCVITNRTHARKYLFRLQKRGREIVGEVKYDKLSIILKLNELNYLLAKIVLIKNQVACFILAQPDVII